MIYFYTEGPDAVPAMNIMVNAIAPILKWTGLEVHMIKSQCNGINHAKGTQVATDSISLNGHWPVIHHFTIRHALQIPGSRNNIGGSLCRERAHP